MDKRLLLLIALAVLGSGSFAAYRKLMYKPEGIKYTIKPTAPIKSGDSIAYDDNTPGASRWKWDFGDGEFSADPNGHHTYLAPGSYNVTLTAYGSFGVQQRSDKVNVTASDALTAPSAPSIAGPASATAGVPATWASSVTAASYEWKVGGSEPMAPQKGATATFAFKKPGAHTLTLTTHTPDHVLHQDVMVAAATPVAAAPTPKPAATSAPMPMPPQHIAPAQHPQAARPAHHDAPKSKGNTLDDLGDGEEVKKK